ncbi:xanthine dehydrogenase family protein molybdopterin-binding subunit [Actinomarinicola tropica]|uniref:Molybdopterin-dependent oxidoreductase n=1 Tax=Actinomarinicola tropica TaxID=2789776 RepID=A0A5Q2RIZ4_9ACTN|nr:xanthine dehydrogenase family protein molybdopterin-binding subunit [Actinomarinicola tropica]QGG96749.1 molybdopterin-dependent oxidoreductase [Actinomarinicola tropica]
MALFGTKVLRVEDPHLLRGESTYVANVDLPGALHVGYVTSTLAHGRIVSVDVDEARRAPGVVDVVTAADVDLGPAPPVSPDYPEAMARPLLATGVVRFVGEPIVAIVAESAAALEDAAELVVVDLDPLPEVVGVEAALGGEVLLFPDAGTNQVNDGTKGAEGPLPFDECEVVAEATFVNQRLAPCPIETRVAAAEWTADDRFTFYASCQGAHPVRNQLAAVYGLDRSQVRVVTRDVGGSFGAKGRAYPEELLLPFLARRAGRPVRFTPDRSQDMVGLGHSRAQRQSVRIGGDRDGTIRCLEADIVGDAGAYPLVGPNLVVNASTLLPGPYRVEHVRARFRSVVTNTTPTTAYRGAGRPEAAALVDRAVDVFAAEVGMDPIEVRRRNLIGPDEFPWSSPTGLSYDSGDYVTALDRALAAVAIDDLRVEQRRRIEAGEERLLGVGCSVFIDRTAGVPGSEYGSVELRPDGGVLVLTGSSPYGQGHHTAWATLVADRTGLPLDRIQVVHGDTDVVPRGGITGGSRSAQKAGTAVVQATEELVDRARQLAADLLEAAPADVVLDLDRGAFHVAGSPSAATVDWRAVAERVAAEGPADGSSALRCESDFAGEGPTFPFGAYVAVVEVDVATGAVELARIVTVDDAGTILNPMLAEGQVHGGLAQGIAQALQEEFVYDEHGTPLTSSFGDYMLPSAADLPTFESELMETPSPNNPLGFKGIAESGTIGGPPAVQNAVIDALSHLGVRHVDMPLTPERVWRAVTGA